MNLDRLRTQPAQSITPSTVSAVALQPVRHKEQVKNQRVFATLPKELAQLIDYVGQQTQADAEEIADMKQHVLHFINAQENGLQTALKGFRQLAQDCELSERCNSGITNNSNLKR